jgi:hypothetical protein
MSDWLTLQTFIAFLLGVLLSATVKSAFGQLKAKAGA